MGHILPRPKPRSRTVADNPNSQRKQRLQDTKLEVATINQPTAKIWKTCLGETLRTRILDKQTVRQPQLLSEQYGDTMTTGSRTRPPFGNRRGGGGGGAFGRRRRGRHVLKAEEIDYKDVQLMRRFVSERGKIVSGQRIGVTAKNQRRLARAIKRAQHLALIPMAPDHVYVTGAVQTETPRPQESEDG